MVRSPPRCSVGVRAKRGSRQGISSDSTKSTFATPGPYRYRVRPPSLINLTVLEDMCLGHNVADTVTILGSIDIVLGEVDR